MRKADEEWLKSMVSAELDLLYPAKKADNQFIYGKDGKPVAFSSLSRRFGKYGGRSEGIIGFSELTTVAVDPTVRGTGLSRGIIARCTGPTLVYTRHPALAKTLLKNGFTQIRWAGLTLSLSVFINRCRKGLWMVFTLQFRRIFHMIRHIATYKLYIKY